ncbi:hypothetical protein JDV09_08985 [Mycobacterium sp. Y57]|uniref:hypothetical protein n=1 Tax=Mycolicibacterium xanthum TaxID=2796469 RepID=UPI001C85169B|nr:hypothetical protein [Mycolicibacterium xanthum]MBX7432241.1 hypothetical protein [Mycolicibacterium xanthum]
MKKTTFAGAAAAGFAAAVVGLAAPVAAAPAGGDAEETISMLEAGGMNRVIVHRLSDRPLSEADVVGIQPGPDIRGRVWDWINNDYYRNVIVGKTYYVDVR